MNILFTSINLPVRNKRDNICYNFIQKEMENLCLHNHNVYFLAEIEEIIINKEVVYLPKNNYLENNSFIRRCNNLYFALSHIFFLKLNYF